MSDIVLQKNLGALIDAKLMSLPLSWTAGTGSDSATFTGLSVDREGFSNGSMPRSMDLEVCYAAVLGSGHTLSIGLDLQDSVDNTNWTDYATEASAVVATGPAGGGAVSGIYRMVVPSQDNPQATPGVNLGSADRYLRPLIVPHLSATGTDTATVAVIGVFGGFDALPAPIS